jgi:hypothetical protein
MTTILIVEDKESMADAEPALEAEGYRPFMLRMAERGYSCLRTRR